MGGSALRTRDAVLAVLMVVLAGVYLWATMMVRVPSFGGPVDARVFPFILGGALVVTAGVTILGHRRAQPEGIEVPDRRQIAKIAGVLAWSVLYAFLLAPLGFILASSLYLAGLSLAYHDGRRDVVVYTAIGFSVALYVVMDGLLGLDLPDGLIGM